MEFEWDQAKNEANIRKHGFDFADAWQIFANPLFIEPDTRKDYGEDWWVGLRTLRGRVAVIVFTERDDGTIRIISLRKADRDEEKQYAKAIQNELDSY